MNNKTEKAYWDALDAADAALAVKIQDANSIRNATINTANATYDSTVEALYAAAFVDRKDDKSAKVWNKIKEFIRRKP